MEDLKLKKSVAGVIEGLDKQGVDGKSVRDIRYDKLPVWWFYRTKFLEGRLPLQSLRHRKLIDAISGNRDMSLYERVMNWLKRVLFAKYIRFNEEVKILVSGFNRRCSSMVEGKKNILVLAHTNAVIPNNSNVGFEIDRIENAIKKIREDDELQEYISVVDPLSHNSLFNLLRYENLIYGYMDRNLRKDVSRKASKLHKQWTEVSAGFCYDSELESKIFTYLQPTLDFVFSKEMIYLALLYYEAYKKVIREWDVKLLVVYAPSGVIARCAIAAADKENIRILHIEHGVDIYGRYPHLPDSVYHAVGSKSHRNALISSGINPDRVFATGPVFMDDIIRYMGSKTKVGDRKRILFATWPSSDVTSDKEWYKQYLKKYLREMNSAGDVEIILKLHPRDKDVMFYKSIINDLGYGNVEIMKTENETQTKDFLYSLIRDSDIVISFGSCVSTEAIVVGTPSLIIELIDIFDSEPPLMSEGIVHINREGDVSGIVKKMLYDENEIRRVLEKSNRAVEKYLYKVDGKAGERVLGIIKELIS